MLQMRRHSSILYAMLWSFAVLGSLHCVQGIFLRAGFVSQSEQKFTAANMSWVVQTPPGLSRTQERDYLLKAAHASGNSFSASNTDPEQVLQQARLQEESNGICIVMPMSSVLSMTKIENQTYGLLGRSVLDTWGNVDAPDIFRLVFPSSEDLNDFIRNYGGKGDPRLLVLDPGVSMTRGEPTFPQRPSPLRLFEAFRRQRFSKGEDHFDCMWYMSADGDGYVNANALRTQLNKLDPSLPYYVGSITGISANWNSSLYGRWAHGATGHLVSRALLESVDWGACVQELQDREEQGEQVIGHDDVETGACIWRHLPAAELSRLDNILWSKDWEENARARTLVDSEDPSWATVAAAHRMSAELNYDAAKLSAKLRSGNSSHN